MTVIADPVLARFQAGLEADRLELPRCGDCEALIWYPRARCPRCTSADLRWETLSGTGTIYSFTVNRRGHGEYADVGPFVIAYVELTEGPRVMAHLAIPPESARIGAPVRLSSGSSPDGRVRLTFVETEGEPTS